MTNKRLRSSIGIAHNLKKKKCIHMKELEVELELELKNEHMKELDLVARA